MITDYKFAPNDQDNTKQHPILGTVSVKNLFEIDWETFKNRTVDEWSQVCQDQYDEVVKLGKAPSPDMSGLTRKASKNTGATAPDCPKEIKEKDRSVKKKKSHKDASLDADNFAVNT